MANPKDPKPTNPDDPADKKKDKPGGQSNSGQSSYDFSFDDVQSYSDLPPVPQPEANDPAANQASLPPRPSVRRPTQGSFDFIDLDADMAALSDPELQLPPVPPLLTPTPAAVEPPPAKPPLLVPTPRDIQLPPLPAPADAAEVLKPTDGGIVIPPVPAAPVASTDIVIELPSVPSILTPTPNPDAALLPPAPGSAADISSLYPAARPPAADADLGEELPMADEDSGSFVMAAVSAAPTAPSSVPMPSDGVINLPPVPAVAFTMSAPEIDLDALAKPAAPPAVEPPAAAAPSAPVIIPTPNPAILPKLPGSAPDVSTLYPATAPVEDDGIPTAEAVTDADLGGPPAGDGSGSFVMTGPTTAPRVPSAVPVPSDGVVSLPPTIPVAFTMSAPEIDLGGPDDPSSGSVPLGAMASQPDLDLSSLSGTNLGNVPDATVASLPDFDLNLPADATQPVPEGFAASVPDIDLGELPADVPSGSFVATSADLDLGEMPPEVPSGSFVATSADLGLGELPPEVPSGSFVASAPDIDPSSTERTAIPEGLFASLPTMDLPSSGENPTIPTGYAASSGDVDLAALQPPLQPPSDVSLTFGALPVPTSDPSSATMNISDIGKLPPAAGSPASAALSAAGLVPPDSADILDIDALAEPLAEPAADEADIGSVHPPSDDQSSSFKMGRSVPELPPIRMPSEPSFQLPPVGLPGSDPSLTSMGSSGTMGSFGSLPSIPLPPPPAGTGAASVPDISILFPTDPPKAEAKRKPFGAPDDALDLPAVPPDATASSVNLGSYKPVAPSDAWLESGVHGAKRTDPNAPPPKRPGKPAGQADESDIFSGRRAKPAGPENSDVIAATAGLSPAGPPGTDPDFDELPLIPEDEFDSATLADAPDLPPGRSPDATDLGEMPEYTSDASSILGGTDDNIDLEGGSAVSLERPGMGGTLGGPGGNFDLTVPDRPVPEGLFDDDPVLPPSGSDLFESGTAADLDFDATVEPVDDDLVADQPSLTSAPSSIFSGGKTPVDLGESDGAVTIEPTDPDMEEAEFNPQPTGIRRTSSGDFELPDVADMNAALGARADDGEIDWDAVSEDENTTRGLPRDASLSALVREQMEENESPTQDEVPVPVVPSTTSGPEVTVDWMNGSSEEAPALDALEAVPPAAPKKPAKPGKPTRKPEPPAEPDFSERPTKPTAAAKAAKKPKPLAATDSGTAEPSGLVDDAKKRSRETRSLFTGVLLGGILAGGLAAGAYFTILPTPDQRYVENKGGKSDGKSDGKTDGTKSDGKVSNVIATVRDANGQPAPAEKLTKAREELEAVIKNAPDEPTKAQATVQLGAVHTLAKDRQKARDLYEAAKRDYPGHTRYFDALLTKMDVEEDKAGEPGALAPRRLNPAEAERLLLELTVLLQEPKADPKPEPEEAGLYYWKAIKAAKDGKYDEAKKLIEQAKAAHIKRAAALAGRGLNPLTDPLEEMFPRACDELVKGWDARAKYEGATKELAGAKIALAKADKDLADAKADSAKAAGELKTAKADLVDAGNKLATAKADLEKLDKDYKGLDKDNKALVTAKGEVEEKLKVADANLTKANKDLSDAQADAKAKGEMFAKVAAELKVKADKPDEVLAAAKTIAGLANGVDAKRVLAAETAAREAKEKLESETKAFKLKYDTDTAKLKTDAVADLEKAKEGYAAKLKEQKDASDKAVADLTAKFDGDLKVQKADADKALKAEQERTAAERQKAADQAVAFQKQLANVITPGQAIDLWLPVLAELRRPADADPAIAAAAKALSASAAGSEDEGKARTTAGMGLLLKGDYASAKTQFQLAVRGAGYAAAKEKRAYWTAVADTGLEATDDPLALYRQPPVLPPVDPRAAAKALDAGISAYKAGRYDAAVTALTTAAKNDPSDPVAWYYLGATRYAKGEFARAEEDIAQGGKREKESSVPGRTVSAALAPIQGRARGLIDRVRP
jgi:hypothetical protein